MNLVEDFFNSHLTDYNMEGDLPSCVKENIESGKHIFNNWLQSKGINAEILSEDDIDFGWSGDGYSCNITYKLTASEDTVIGLCAEVEDDNNDEQPSLYKYINSLETEHKLSGMDWIAVPLIDEVIEPRDKNSVEVIITFVTFVE